MDYNLEGNTQIYVMYALLTKDGFDKLNDRFGYELVGEPDLKSRFHKLQGEDFDIVPEVAAVAYIVLKYSDFLDTELRPEQRWKDKDNLQIYLRKIFKRDYKTGGFDLSDAHDAVDTAEKLLTDHFPEIERILL